MTTSKIDQDVKAICQALGIEENDLRVVMPNWVNVMRQGVIVTLHLSRWRAIARLTPEHLGLSFEDQAEQEAFEKTMRLGDVYLLPDRYLKTLNSIDSGARKAIKKFAAQTYHGDFLTPQAFVEWREENEQFEARYFQVRNEVFDNWQSILFEVADSHMANARAAYRREKAHSQATGKTSQLVEKYTESQFVSQYVDAILAAIPGAQEVFDSFGYKVDLAYIPLPSMIAEDQAEAEVAFLRVQTERAKSEAEIAMHREVMDNYKARANELVVGHMKSLVATLNDTLYQAALDVLTTTQANQRLHPRSVVQLRAAIDRIRALNVLDYGDIEKMVSQAESILTQAPEGRTTTQVEAKLRDIATVTRATLITLDAMPDRGRRVVEVADVPTAQVVRQARARLGLGTEGTPQVPQTRQARVDGI